MELGDIELYRGREQSFIKHQFLVQYLQFAAFKTLQSVSPVFNYVDAFAGPWNINDSVDFADTSFDLAIRMLEEVRAKLGSSGIAGLKIRFCLCEKRRDSVALLRQYAAKKGAFEIHVFEGEFEENLDAIATKLPDGFTFTFIDPTGWNIKNSKVFNFLKDRRGDFLLNFMSDHINRHAEYAQVTASFGYFLANPDWENEYAALPYEWSAEERVLFLLKNKMKHLAVARFIPDFSILVPRKERIKMRLVLGTNSNKGLQVFRDVQSKAEQSQVIMRNRLRGEATQQNFLFDDETMALIQLEQDGFGGKFSRQKATGLIIELLQENGLMKFSQLSESVLEQVGIRLTQLKDLFVALKKQRLINFELAPRKQKPQEDTIVGLVERISKRQ
jgi:three-Cys-motif partner protein